MIAMRILCLLYCGCFVIVNSQSTVDETSGQCSNDEYTGLLETIERTCRPTQQVLHTYQQLLRRHEQLLNQVSTKLMSIDNVQITRPTSGMDVEKKHLVSALTGMSVNCL